MSKSFGEAKGSGTASKLPQYEYKMGEHRFRLVGNILPRYVYWVEGTNGKNLPVECLGFDRDSEEFLNKEKDWVREFFPNLKCSWSYAMLCIDLDGSEPELKIINFKRKMYEQIKTTAEDLGDPSCPEEGWDVVFDKKKTGPHVMNVEYTVKPLKCSKFKRPLTDAERALVEEGVKIDEVLPRQTPEKQKEFLERIMKGGEDGSDDSPSDDVSKEFDGESPQDLD